MHVLLQYRLNDLPEASNIFKFIMYADDTTLFSPCKYFNSTTRENNDIISEKI